MKHIIAKSVPYFLWTEKKSSQEKVKGLPSSKGICIVEEVDYDDIFSLIMRDTSIRAMLALVASHDMHLEHMDVKTTFLHNDLGEQIYMEQP